MLIKYSTESGVEQEFSEGVNQLNKGQGETLLFCHIWEKTFYDRGTLARHKRIHTGEIPYQCDTDICERAFAENSKLTRHKNKHLCHYCEKLSLSMWKVLFW